MAPMGLPGSAIAANKPARDRSLPRPVLFRPTKVAAWKYRQDLAENRKQRYRATDRLEPGGSTLPY